MEIKISEQVLTDAVSAAVAQGVARGVGSYEVTQAVEAAAKAAVLEVDLPRLVGVALGRVLQTQAEEIVADIARRSVPVLSVALAQAVAAPLARMAVELEGCDYTRREARTRELLAEWMTDCPTQGQE